MGSCTVEEIQTEREEQLVGIIAVLAERAARRPPQLAFGLSSDRRPAVLMSAIARILMPRAFDAPASRIERIATPRKSHPHTGISSLARPHTVAAAVPAVFAAAKHAWRLPPNLVAV